MLPNANQHTSGRALFFSGKLIDDLFREHPAAVGETYAQHLSFTIRIGWYLLVTTAALVFHGLVPMFCQTTASDRILRLASSIKKRRERADRPADDDRL